MEFDVAAGRADTFATALDDVNESSELNYSNRIIDYSEGVDRFGQALRDASDAGIDFVGVDLIPDTWAEVRDMPDELDR